LSGGHATDLGYTSFHSRVCRHMRRRSRLFVTSLPRFAATGHSLDGERTRIRREQQLRDCQPQSSASLCRLRTRMLNDPCDHPLRWITYHVRTIFTPMRSGNHNSKPIQRIVISLSMPQKGKMSEGVPCRNHIPTPADPVAKDRATPAVLLHALGGK
jgi:hypothetical protein